MATAKKKIELPKYCYARGTRIWVRYKNAENQWVNKKTEYTTDQVEQARRYVTTLLRAIETKREQGAGAPNNFREYVAKWAKERAARGIAAAEADLAKIEKYVHPHLGPLAMEAIRPRHIRDMVRAHRKLRDDEGAPALAPRTIHHIFMAVYNVFENAIVDELVFENPVKVKPGELPKKVDSDSEWRINATYTVAEVRALLTSELLPVERRVQYAFKALAGLRHGEVAALQWRHLDWEVEPLPRIHVVQAWDSLKNRIKGTKTEEVRAVPMHDSLKKIVRAWHDKHWAIIYGRAPSADDFVVPTRNMSCVAASDANDAFKRDLAALNLRIEAGKKRDRGGHDLRSWYETSCIEDGADSMLLRRTTHAPPKTVSGGYERFSWATLCREVAKLNLRISDSDVLKLGTRSLQSAKKAGARWTSVVTPKGLEPWTMGSPGLHLSLTAMPAWVDVSDVHTRSVHRVTASVTRPERVRSAVTAGAMLERALRSGDIPRALQIAAELKRGKRG